MKLIYLTLFTSFIFVQIVHTSVFAQEIDYLEYHQQIILEEKLIVNKEYHNALAIFQTLESDYDFIFLKDYKIAAQLAVLTNDTNLATDYLKKCLSKGWNPDQIKKNELLENVLVRIPIQEQDSLRDQLQNTIDLELKDRVGKMFKADQKLAMAASLKLGEKARVRFAETVFAPQSEQHIRTLIGVIDQNGYPGEMLIGDNIKASVLLCHHNSISPAYNQKDTLYAYIKPMLMSALKDGFISPFEYAIIDNWRIASLSNHEESSYGYLGPELDSATLSRADSIRSIIGLRSIALRNLLMDTQTETGINFYLPGEPWQEGKIKVKD